jgi:hypothetical protein
VENTEDILGSWGGYFILSFLLSPHPATQTLKQGARPGFRVTRGFKMQPSVYLKKPAFDRKQVFTNMKRIKFVV